MTHSYIAYIDESGDDGLRKFREVGKGGSTRWLVISCCVARYAYDLDFVKWRDQITNSKKREIHFRNLTHSQKLMACQKIADFPLRSITILSNKVTIPTGTYTQKNQLYFYVTRYLMERLSWLCRDIRHLVRDGDGRVKIIFSKRGGMDYEAFREYLRTLRNNNALGNRNNIHWPVIDIDAVDAKDHSTRAGLQIADCISTAFRMAVDPDEYGNCESRYAKELKQNAYNHRGKFLSYGVKPIPPVDKMTLTPEQNAFFDFFKTQ